MCTSEGSLANNRGRRTPAGPIPTGGIGFSPLTLPVAPAKQPDDLVRLLKEIYHLSDTPSRIMQGTSNPSTRWTLNRHPSRIAPAVRFETIDLARALMRGDSTHAQRQHGTVTAASRKFIQQTLIIADESVSGVNL